ncbi:ubiquitin-like-specific protease 1D isoform X2 [Andrographis paniculata]|uniref:ubiquitin-like-specific protease 1D isoform X2 n=1 Tax=Andrographis paniculata TaxID=175694 RepID=UPI0021E6FEDE|nr:ubiquitin-like-specific protease 1D isoform X2 [Andrographis paniculata]
MEGGGGGGDRKRKVSPIHLDWETLLPSGVKDEEPLPLEVVGDGEDKPEPQAEVMTDGGEDESAFQYLRQLSDKDLLEKITRVKNNLEQMSSKLPDGGAKFRANLLKHEAEWKRRKALKDNNKVEEIISVGEKSSCLVDDRSTCGAPPSRPVSQSTFALRFCSTMDDKELPKKAFTHELSTLNHSDHQIMERNEAVLSQGTQRLSSSSRKVPFKSPTHLSVNIDDPPQLSDKDASVSDSLLNKRSSFLSQPTPNSRRNKKTVVLVDEELEVDAINQVENVGRSHKEAQIFYPSRDDPEAIEICFSDLECLAPESYLSSTIMNFYIRYLQKSTSPTARNRCGYLFFNTYFYKKLKGDGPTKITKEKSYQKFRRWWKGVNIFEKAYIFLPIHEHLHWSLVIICIPKKEDESGPLIILHLDSLGLHDSSSIFRNVKRFLIEEWKFLREEEKLPEPPIAANIWNKLSRRIEEKVVQVPQQKNEYDCGVFVLYFMERFIHEAPERLHRRDLEMFGREWFKPEDASSLRKKIFTLLREEFKNAGTSASDGTENGNH